VKSPSPRNPVVALRIPPEDLEAIEEARRIMGDSSLSAFMRRSARMVAGAIIEAAGQLGDTRPGFGSWDRAWIEGSITRKED
jgi:uncharacterized protein (DUF1778 family)